jgi:hypothetical protein
MDLNFRGLLIKVILVAFYIYIYNFLIHVHDFINGFASRITRRVPLVEQKFLFLRSYHPFDLNWGSSFSYMCSVLWFIVDPIDLFHLTITFPVFRFTATDFPFAIFKLPKSRQSKNPPPTHPHKTWPGLILALINRNILGEFLKTSSNVISQSRIVMYKNNNRILQIPLWSRDL